MSQTCEMNQNSRTSSSIFYGSIFYKTVENTEHLNKDLKVGIDVGKAWANGVQLESEPPALSLICF